MEIGSENPSKKKVLKMKTVVSMWLGMEALVLHSYTSVPTRYIGCMLDDVHRTTGECASELVRGFTLAGRLAYFHMSTFTTKVSRVPW